MMKTFTWLLWVALLPLWGSSLDLPRAAVPGPPPAYAWQIDRSCAAACRVTLNGIDMVSAVDGWAVGERGAILHWDGSRWQPVDSPTTVTLRSVAMVSAADGWAVGGDTGYIWTRGVILHWDGREWQVAAEPEVRLGSVSMSSAEHGWAAGYRYMPYGHSYGVLLRWNGAGWTGDSGGAGDAGVWAGVSMTAPDAGWLVSAGWYESAKLLRWDGERWGYGDAPWAESPIELAGVAAAADGGGWAVGAGMVNLATLETWVPTPAAWLSAVTIAAAGDAWALGSEGAIFHWNGSNWQRAASPTGLSLNGAEMVSGTDGWAVGENGVILRYTDAPPSPPPVYLPLLMHG